MTSCYSSTNISVAFNDSGRWYVSGVFGVKLRQQVTVIPKPYVSKLGPVVIQQDLKRLLIINPRYTVKKVVINMQLSAQDIQPECAPFLKSYLMGWDAWVISSEPTYLSEKRLRCKSLGRSRGRVRRNQCYESWYPSPVHVGHDMAALEQP